MNKNNPHPECHQCQVRFKSVFCDLGKEDLDTINNNKGCNTYQKGQIIFYEDAIPHGLFCINNGKVKVSQAGEAGKEQIVRLAKEGDILGYRALLSGEKYSCSATALDTTSICFIPKQTFFGLIDKNANLSKEILKLLSHDLRKAEHKITDLAQKPVRERLAEALLFLKETYGLEPDDATLDVVLSREEIANIVGTATETTIRLLSEFKQDKMIDLKGKKITFLNLPSLIKTANIND
ncbi:MAG: Crp/Fnr family transcriptional regulator [Bacteroidia bacterium]|nr:Crp/Fnr family transcriptional regulator [Bacteroidia bacterium]HQV00201.1 Crp/Fnr family transcriptional regulator [Bacteroidia bacterium]